MEKDLIYYHRSYRKITGSPWIFMIECLAATLPLCLAVLFFYPAVTKQMSLAVQAILSSYYPPDTVTVIEKSFLLENMSLVSMPGTYPSAITCLVNFLVSLGLIFFLPRVRGAKNAAIFVVFMAFINLASAVFFTLAPFEFPYTATEFSELYIKSEISMWLFVPLILGIALFPLPAPVLPKLLVIILTLIYSVIFGTLRYAIFLFVISKFSMIYMAVLFFVFGPFIDFVYIVGAYSFYVSRLARKLKDREPVWKWLS
jgi:hypothetical protein